MAEPAALRRLRNVLKQHPRLAIAVSGGVDSMTLAHVAHHAIDMQAVHAMSPAVPSSATRRVRDHALRYGWALTTTDAGEFDDPRYRDNPANRCFFCKTNLYDRIATLTDRTIASGTNTDDLLDTRPGLIAASQRGVVHPFVEAGVSKVELRSIARYLTLDDLAELPAQPCLSSRIETGIRIDADDLTLVDGVERAVREALPQAREIRCRITARGLLLQVDDGKVPATIEACVRRMAADADHRFAGIAPYRRGSAFLSLNK